MKTTLTVTLFAGVGARVASGQAVKQIWSLYNIIQLITSFPPLNVTVDENLNTTIQFMNQAIYMKNMIDLLPNETNHKIKKLIDEQK